MFSFCIHFLLSYQKGLDPPAQYPAVLQVIVNHRTTMATCAASTRSSSRKTKKKYKQRQTSNSPHISDCLMLHCFTPRLMRTAAMKCDFTDITENEQAEG